MSRNASVWWNAQKKAWCSDVGGQRKVLAHGRRSRAAAETKLRALLDQQALLREVHGAITVARLCEQFLADSEQNLERATYESYRYGCQKFVDLFGDRLAHTLEPLDIQRFSLELKRTLNDTSRAIVLRSVQRCFNWGVESRLIPPHHLGRIRKPKSRTRDRYLADDEFQKILRATNPRDARRIGAPFRRLLLAMDWTLCRPSELARLKWEHVHLNQNVAILPHHKTKRTGKPKVVPLIPKLKRLLQWVKRHQTSDHCFLNSRGEPWTLSAIEQRMKHVKDRSGIHDVVPYTIRHRAATNAILRTGDLKMTSLLLGHTSTATTERYTHLAQQHLVNFAERAVG